MTAIIIMMILKRLWRSFVTNDFVSMVIATKITIIIVITVQ